MTDPIADAVLDEVMMLGIELAAVAKPRDPTKFVALLQRFTHAVVREAFEHQDEVRALLNLPRVNAVVCPACSEEITGPARSHQCARMVELGLVDASRGTRSTGAAAAETKAEQTEPTHAADAPTPAAPPMQSTLPAAGRVSSEPSQEGSGSATGGADSPLAEPAPPPQPSQPLSGPAADGAGAPPAGVSAGAEASQHSRQRRMTPEQVASLRAAFDRARDENDGDLPVGWISRQSELTGFTVQSIYGRVVQWKREPYVPAARRIAAPPKDEDLAHTETPACWCRRKPASRDNVWCKLRPREKPPTEHAALRAPQPRVTRMQGTRY